MAAHKVSCWNMVPVGSEGTKEQSTFHNKNVWLDNTIPTITLATLNNVCICVVKVETPTYLAYSSVCEYWRHSLVKLGKRVPSCSVVCETLTSKLTCVLSYTLFYSPLTLSLSFFLSLSPSHTLLSSVPRQKNTQNYFRPRNHYGHFPEFGGLLRGPGYFGPELEVEIKNPGWQSFCPPMVLAKSNEEPTKSCNAG